MKKLSVVMVCAVCALGFAVQTASAIPPFDKEFKALYVENNDNAAFVDAVKTAKCNVCHMGKDKKDRNPYGMEIGKLINKKDHAKDPDKIREALQKVAAT